jgi:hypothetical protein
VEEFMSEGITVGSITAAPGERAYGGLPVCRLSTGMMLEIPIYLVAGARPGPTLGILSAQHGNEVKSLAVLREVVHRINPQELRGNLAIVTLANPIAFEHSTRGSWIDALYGNGGNLNMLWPGRPDGFIVEKMAHVIHQEFMPHVNAVIDLHGAVTGQLTLYYGFIVGGPAEIAARNRELSINLGMEIIMRRAVKPISFSDYAVREWNIPAVACELGDFNGLAVDGKDKREGPPRRMPEIGVTAILNLMKQLKMIEGEPVLPKRQVIVSPETNVRTQHGGLLFPTLTPDDIGTVFPKGTELGVVVDPRSLEVIERVVAPYEMNILIAAPQGLPCTLINSGDFSYLVADWKTAEWVER